MFLQFHLTLFNSSWSKTLCFAKTLSKEAVSVTRPHLPGRVDMDLKKKGPCQPFLEKKQSEHHVKLVYKGEHVSAHGFSPMN